MADMQDSLLQWDDDEKTMIRFAWQGKWSWDDYYRFHERAWEMLRTVEHPVHVIYDCRQINTFGSNAISHFTNMAKKYPPNVDKIVGVGMNAFQRAIGEMYGKMAGAGGKISDGQAGHLILFDTLEEAHAALREVGEKELEK